MLARGNKSTIIHRFVPGPKHPRANKLLTLCCQPWRRAAFTHTGAAHVALGCDFVIPIRGYADTQKMVRSFFLFAAVLSRICFVKFCQIRVFLAQIPGYTQENDHFLSVYSFFRIRRTNSPSTWNSYSCVFDTCANMRTSQIAVFLSKICHFVTKNRRLGLHTPIPTLHCFVSVCHCSCCGGGAQRDGGSAVAAAQRLRWWRQRDSARSVADWRRRGGSGSISGGGGKATARRCVIF